MYSESDGESKSPLNLNDLKLIEQAELSSRDRHFVRLLGHCLACFKLMVNASDNREIPSKTNCLEWLETKSGYKVEKDFLLLLLDQLVVAGEKLECIGEHYQLSPLELTLEQVIDFVEQQKDLIAS